MQFMFWQKGCFEESQEKVVMIDAIDLENAKIKHKNYCINNDKYFLQSCYIGCVNDGFAQNLWLSNEEEHDRFMEDDGEHVDYEIFKERVRKFFSKNPEYADLFIKNYEEYIDADYEDFFDFDITRHPQFPHEMLEILWDSFEAPKWDENYCFLDMSTVACI